MAEIKHAHGHGGHVHHGHGHGGHSHHHCEHDQGAHDHHHDHPAAPASDANLVKDPVCGMNVDPHRAKHRAQYGGKPYYFCSVGCQAKFIADPSKYTGAETPKAE